MQKYVLKIQMCKLSFHNKAFYKIWKVFPDTNIIDSMVPGHLCVAVTLWYVMMLLITEKLLHCQNKENYFRNLFIYCYQNVN